MEIKDLIDKKEALEDEISNYIRDRVNSFVEETGVSLKGIYISTTDIVEFGSNKMILVGTDIQLDL